MKLIGRTIQKKHLSSFHVANKSLPSRFVSPNAIVRANAFLIRFDFEFFPVTWIAKELEACKSAEMASESNPKPQCSKQERREKKNGLSGGLEHHGQTEKNRKAAEENCGSQ